MTGPFPAPAIAILCLLLGCSAEPDQQHEANASPEPTTPAQPEAGPPAPDPQACVSDADCMSTPYPFEDHLCCDMPQPYVANLSRAYRTWLDQQQAGPRCAEAGCDAVLEAFAREQAARGAPAPPSPCYFEPRCVQGRCTDSCG